MCTFDIPQLLFYTHLPALIISLFLGIFIYFSNRHSKVNKYLFVFILFLSFWIVTDFLPFLTYNVRFNLFFVRMGSLVSLAPFFFLLFVYAFMDEAVSFKKKMVLFLPFVPIIVLIPTVYNAYIADSGSCSSQYGFLIWYIMGIVLAYMAMSVIKLYVHYKKFKNEEKVKNQTGLIGASIAFIVLWEALFSILANTFANDDIYMFVPVGIVIFIGLITYTITKYQFLKIKLLAVQALTYTIWILIGSQYFFADDVIVYLLISFTLLLSILFGIMLIKSIKMEHERKEELQVMADKLAVANDELRKLDNAKTEFISIASHQLRTPLTAIKGFLSLILEGTYGQINTEVRGALDKVYLSGEQLIQLVEDLLNVSRIESGRMQFTFDKGDVTDIIKELYANFTLAAKSKNLYLEIKLPEDEIPEIVMDKVKIREVVSNLIDNALKYSDKGGVTITAEIIKKGMESAPRSPLTVNSEKGAPIDGDAVRITVSDTGVGIPAEEMPYLFKKFSRGKDIARLHVGGTGLGIYVAKNIMEAHHGRVWVESEGAGKGSRFIMELPISS